MIRRTLPDRRPRWFPAGILLAWLALVVPGRADTYAQWAARVFSAAEQANPAVSGETACPAGDGVSNLLKFAFDLDPHQNGAAGLPTVTLRPGTNASTGQPDGFAALTYRVPTRYQPEGITCVPELCADLAAGRWVRGAQIFGFAGTQASPDADGPPLYTFQALSPVSRNPAGLLLRLRVVEGHQLPADWCQACFGTAAGIDPEADPDGDGATNWQEFLAGNDPTDFYNGTLPTLSLAGGGNQRGAQGTTLPLPISVRVNSYGAYNAPLSFAVTSGHALLAADHQGTYAPAATVNLRAVNLLPDAQGFYHYVAQAFVFLPHAGNEVSTVTVTAQSGAATTRLSTTEITSDPSLQPPGNFGLVRNTATTADLAWTPGDPTRATGVEASYDHGVTWQGLTSFPPGASAGQLTHLTPDAPLRVRLFTAGGPGSGGGGAGTPNNAAAASGNADGGGGGVGSDATGGRDVDPLSVPVVVGERAEFAGHNNSYAGFQSSPTNRYLHAQVEYTHYDDPDPSVAGGHFFLNRVMDPKSGYPDMSATFDGIVPDYEEVNYQSPGWIIDDDQNAHNTIANYGTEHDAEKALGHALLSVPYPLEQFIADEAGWVPAFTGQRADGVDQARILFQAAAGWAGGDGLQPLVSSYDHAYDVAKLQYQFRCNQDPEGTVVYDVVFTPDDGSEPVHQPQALPTGGGRLVPDDTQGQALLTLDPLQAGDPRLLDASQPNGKKNGAYQVVPVELGPDDWNADSLGQVSFDGEQTGTTGAMVPSSQGPGGQKHFVSPKAAGGTVVLRASLPKDVHFDDYFVWEVTDAATGQSTPATQTSNDRVRVPRDVPGQYVVKVMARPADPAAAPTQEITRLNVWVVWDTIQLVSKGAPVPDYTSSVGGGLASTFISAGYDAFHTIVPPNIITDNERPDMSGKNTVPVAGADQHHPYTTERTLSQGVNSKWDPSQQARVKLVNPNNIGAQFFPGQHYPPEVKYPDDPLLGNDDIYSDNGSIDPYAHHGILSIADLAQFGIADDGGNDGDTFEWRLQCISFGRAQIGNFWYRISDSVPWRVHFKFKKVSGLWISNMTAGDMATDNDNY